MSSRPSKAQAHQTMRCAPCQVLYIIAAQRSGKHVGRTAASDATAAAGGMVELTRGGRRGMPACAWLRLELPLPFTLDVSVWPAVVADQAPLYAVPEPVPCHTKSVLHQNQRTVMLVVLAMGLSHDQGRMIARQYW